MTCPRCNDQNLGNPGAPDLPFPVAFEAGGIELLSTNAEPRVCSNCGTVHCPPLPGPPPEE